MSAEAIDHATRRPRTPTRSVERVLAFVNTRAGGGGRQELFADATTFRSWLRDHAELGEDIVVTDADAAAARELRDALVTLLLVHSGDPQSADEQLSSAERQLCRAGALYPLSPVITGHDVKLSSPQIGVQHVFGSVMAAVTEFALSGEWSRIKACRNPPCRFGFVDKTRNGSALYCSSGCNSRVAMRRYRARQQKDNVSVDKPTV
ncbi:CGNR zinc finger domain-containing protein [Rhodococcus koreensis]